MYTNVFLRLRLVGIPQSAIIARCFVPSFDGLDRSTDNTVDRGTDGPVLRSFGCGAISHGSSSQQAPDHYRIKKMGVSAILGTLGRRANYPNLFPILPNVAFDQSVS
jgi:hypothetical protein